jgi:hypothetical protein
MLWNWCTNDKFNYEFEYIFILQLMLAQHCNKKKGLKTISFNDKIFMKFYTYKKTTIRNNHFNQDFNLFCKDSNFLKTWFNQKWISTYGNFQHKYKTIDSKYLKFSNYEFKINLIQQK